jgi:hypothetical protein
MVFDIIVGWKKTYEQYVGKYMNTQINILNKPTCRMVSHVVGPPIVLQKMQKSFGMWEDAMDVCRSLMLMLDIRGNLMSATKTRCTRDLTKVESRWGHLGNTL